jgi:hypothetical protein
MRFDMTEEKIFIINDEIAKENLRNVESGLPLTVPLKKLMNNKIFYKAYKKAYQKTDKYKAYKKAYQKAYQKTDKYKAYKKAYQKAYQKTDKYKAYKKAYQKAYYQNRKGDKNLL